MVGQSCRLLTCLIPARKIRFELNPYYPRCAINAESNAFWVPVMSDSFHMRLVEDHDRHRVYIETRGQMDPAQYIDRQIAQIQANPDLCAYDRVTDLRGSIGFVTGDHVTRYAAFWQGLRFDMPRIIRVAVITENRLVIARLPMANLSYPKQIMQAFATPDAADAWLDSYRWGLDGADNQRPAANFG